MKITEVVSDKGYVLRVGGIVITGKTPRIGGKVKEIEVSMGLERLGYRVLVDFGEKLGTIYYSCDDLMPINNERDEYMETLGETLLKYHDDAYREIEKGLGYLRKRPMRSDFGLEPIGRCCVHENDALSDIKKALETSNKPPIGVMPRNLHDEVRQKALASAITHYVKDGRKVNQEWIDEFNELCNRINPSKNKDFKL